MNKTIVIIMVVVLTNFHLMAAVLALAAVKTTMHGSMTTRQAVRSKVLDYLGQHGEIS